MCEGRGGKQEAGHSLTTFLLLPAVLGLSANNWEISALCAPGSDVAGFHQAGLEEESLQGAALGLYCSGVAADSPETG